jgi:signal transduction histidine kinase
MTGYTEAELRELTHLDLSYEADRPAALERWSRLGAGLLSPYSVERRFRCKDRGSFWARVTVSTIPGEPGCVLAVVEDATGSKQKEDLLLRGRDQLRALAARVQSVREEERKSLARELHDELGQALTALKLEFGSFLRHPPPGAQEREGRAQEILRFIDETIQSVGRLAANLRPGMLDDLGLVAAVEWAARGFEARTGAKCALELPPRDIAIEPDTATALFRILQEALTNVARHAEATEVVVRLAGEADGVRLEVRDNGKGFDNGQLEPRRSLGLLGMTERALLLGGRMSIESSPGKGSTVTAWMPRGRQ